MLGSRDFLKGAGARADKPYLVGAGVGAVKKHLQGQGAWPFRAGAGEKRYWLPNTGLEIQIVNFKCL